MNNQDSQIQQIITELKDQPGALLPILHETQALLGYISAQAQAQIAEGLNISRAEVHGVVSFYQDFKTEPGAKYTIQICRAEACQSVGGRRLEQHIKKQLSTAYNQSSQDGQIQLEPVYCLGNCACGPSLRIGDDIHGRVTTDKADALVADLVANLVTVLKNPRDIIN